MSVWNYIVLFLSLLLLAMLLWWEIRRGNKARLIGRIVATVLLVVSLAAIALPLTYTSGRRAEDREGVLLTEGYDPDSARNYLSAGVEVKNIEDMPMTALHILGYGLTEDERAYIPKVPILFHPSPMRTGVVSLYWKRQVLPGEPIRIQGSFYNATGAPVKLLLFGIGRLLDSVEAPSKEDSFELKTVPLQADRAVYSLMAVSGKDTIEREPIPVEVQRPGHLKILMLAASPDFENRFLADWLSGNGDGVVVRTAISKDKYDHAYLNTSPMAVDHLSPSLLDKFDVVIADAAELKEMGTAAHTCLWNAIAEKGLGLVIKGDSSSQPGESMHGSGKIVTTTLHATYAQLLAGERKEYALFWTRILQQAAGKKEAAEQWSFSPDLPVVDHPVKVRLQTAASMPQGRLQGRDDENGSFVDVYLEQHPFLPFYWTGWYWPRESGWQSANTPEKEPGLWYVWDKDDWKNIHRRERLEGTLQWIAARKLAKDRPGDKGKDPAVDELEVHKVLVAKGWFYLLLLLSAIFLWVERRI